MMREQKITGEMRSNNGPRRLIVYCADFKCCHSVAIVHSVLTILGSIANGRCWFEISSVEACQYSDASPHIYPRTYVRLLAISLA